MNWVLELRTGIGIPHTLVGINIGTEKIDQVAKMATEDPSHGGNPISFDVQAYAEILKNAVEGRI